MGIVTASTQDAENSIINILQYIGENPSREGLKETPKRVVRSWEKLYGGYKMNAGDILGKSFTEYGEYDEMVILKDIDFFSTCEHHLLPIIGKAHVAYIPRHKVVGISKLARLVEMYARRLQIQERMTTDIANDIQTVLDPIGVAVMIEAQHFCIKARGIEKVNSIMVTSKLIGAFKNNPSTRDEFYSMVVR